MIRMNSIIINAVVMIMTTMAMLMILHCLLSLLQTLESDTRGKQRCVLLRVTSLRSHSPCVTKQLPRILATRGATQSERKGGEARRDSALLLLHNRVP
jgi:hypothetical protein